MCFICEYTTVPRILSNNATANVSRVNRKVIANTRTGIPTQRGPAEFVFAMLLGYTNPAKPSRRLTRVLVAKEKFGNE